MPVSDWDAASVADDIGMAESDGQHNPIPADDVVTPIAGDSVMAAGVAGDAVVEHAAMDPAVPGDAFAAHAVVAVHAADTAGTCGPNHTAAPARGRGHVSIVHGNRRKLAFVRHTNAKLNQLYENEAASSDSDVAPSSRQL